jgi:hypothetical protein
LSIAWDDPVHPDIEGKKVHLQVNLPMLKQIVVDRRITGASQQSHFELHSISDVSEVTYGACAYL